MVYLPDAQGDRIPDFGMVGYEHGASFPSVPIRATIASTPSFNLNSPCSNDDRTADIQAQLDSVGDLTPGTAGAPPNFKGTVQLAAGYYAIFGTLNVESGVVLKGAGSVSGAGGTTLFACGYTEPATCAEGIEDYLEPPLIQFQGLEDTVPAHVATIVDDLVPVGAQSFRVDTTGALSPGLRIAIRRVVTVQADGTSKWIQKLKMDQLSTVDPAADNWTAAEYGLRFERVITSIDGNRVFVDAPLTNAIERTADYAIGRISAFPAVQRVHHAGVIGIRGFDRTARRHELDCDPCTFVHRRNFVEGKFAENLYVADIASEYFGRSAVFLWESTRSVTVEDAAFESPAGPGDPKWRYSFDNNGQLSLLRRCMSEEGRHDFVMGGQVAGPNVFQDCVAIDGRNTIGPHQRWGTGALFDNIDIVSPNSDSHASYVPDCGVPDSYGLNEPRFESVFAGTSGSGHGWRGASMIFWNDSAPSFEVVNPFSAQSWVVGVQGSVSTGDPSEYSAFNYPAPYAAAPPPAYQDRVNAVVTPSSLYTAQAADRAALQSYHWTSGNGLWSTAGAWTEKATPASRKLEVREYVLGDMDEFANDADFETPGSIDMPYVDPAFITYMNAPYVGLDHVKNSNGTPFTGGRNVAFTFTRTFSSTERVVHGTLALSLRRLSGGSGINTDYVELWGGSAQTFTSLGWLPVPMAFVPSATDPTAENAYQPARVWDLGDQLDRLTTGYPAGTGNLSVRVNDDTAVDFALLSLTVASPDSTGTWPTVEIPNPSEVQLDVSSNVLIGNIWGTLRLRPSTVLRALNLNLKWGSKLRVEGGTALINFLEVDAPIYLNATGGAVSGPPPIETLQGTTFYSNASLVVLATGTLAAGQVVQAIKRAGQLPYPIPRAYCYDSSPNWRYVPCHTDEVGGIVRVVVGPRITPLRYGEQVVLKSEWWGTYLSASGTTLSANTTLGGPSSRWMIKRASNLSSATDIVLNNSQVVLQNVATGQYLAENGTSATMLPTVSSPAGWTLKLDSCGCYDNSTVLPGAANLWVEARDTLEHLKAMTTTSIQVISGAGGYSKWRIHEAPLVNP